MIATAPREEKRGSEKNGIRQFQAHLERTTTGWVRRWTAPASRGRMSRIIDSDSL
jgi:hypothetical protein